MVTKHTYQKIAAEIRDRIRNGDLQPGDHIPSLPAIREQYRVSYVTAQSAVALLKAWGLVEGRQGLGTVVREARPVIDSIDGADVRSYSWRAVAARHGATGTTRVVDVGPTPAPAEVTDAFGYEAGTEVVWRKRHILADDVVVQIVESYYSPEVVDAVPELTRPAMLRTWAPGLMAERGIEATVRDIAIAREATEDEAETLRLSECAPVLEILRTAQASGVVVMVEIMVSNSARIRHVWDPES